MVEEHAALARIGAPIAFPEAPYGTRLAAELSDAHDAVIVERAYRRALFTSAAIGTGWMMPMGFEYGVTEPMSQTRGDASHFALAAQARRLRSLGTHHARQPGGAQYEDAARQR